MTVGEMYRRLRVQLEQAGCESPAFDARCLLEDLCGIAHGQLPVHTDTVLSEQQKTALIQAAQRRCAREPLQYILQQWDFLGLTLEVGHGVLIPRADTETLCYAAQQHLQCCPTRRVLDLCAGSGCVGLGTAFLVPQTELTFVEYYDAALQYLRRNTQRYAPDARIIQADVLCPPPLDAEFDVILSNPPYIQTDEIVGLQPEVGFEPVTALDGGQDGYLFYRAIIRYWLPLLAPCGMIAFEVGAGQAQDVGRLLEQAGCTVEICQDAAGIDRVVCGYKEKK